MDKQSTGLLCPRKQKFTRPSSLSSIKLASPRRQFRRAVEQAIGGPDLSSSIYKNSLYFTILGFLMWGFVTIQILCSMFPAARQTTKIRIYYFLSILQQDIGFFDLNPATELNTRLAE